MLSVILGDLDPDTKLIMTSGGLDVPHWGHFRLITESLRVTEEPKKLLVIVNGDGFLIRKKGYFLMPESHRAEMVDCIHGVDFVVIWDDGTQFVDGAIRLFKPDYFTKGGDRSTPDSVCEEERAACRDVGCEIVYGVGGAEKLESSSRLAEKMREYGHL